MIYRAFLIINTESMKFLEKDLEEIIFTASREKLSKKGLHISGRLFRQLRIGEYGVSDLVEFSKETVIIENKFIEHVIRITVYELKKDKIGVSAFMQALGYLKGIDRYLSIRFPYADIKYNIVLIGSDIDKNSSFTYLPEFLINSEGESFLSNFTYSYGVDGIEFEHEYGYKLTNEGFYNE